MLHAYRKRIVKKYLTTRIFANNQTDFKGLFIFIDAAMETACQEHQMVFASMRAVRIFLRARVMIEQRGLWKLQMASSEHFVIFRQLVRCFAPSSLADVQNGTTC